MEVTSDIKWDTNILRSRDREAITNGNRALHKDADCHNVSDTELEQPRKYRIRKRHWQPDEDTLGEVLQQELMAWRDSHTNQATVRRTLRSPVGPATKKKVQAPVYFGESTSELFDGKTSSTLPQDDLNPSYRSPPTTSVVKKSNFSEGSMNQTSRGIASVWTDALSIPSTTSKPISVFSEPDSESSTPRDAPSSCISMSSSMDINEFKPLPPTPTTFKATMRRIGHKFKPVDTSAQEKQLDTIPNPSKAQRKGLRKSLSTWKFFDSVASEADDEAVPDAPEIEQKTIRHAVSSRTLFGRHKQQPQVDQILVLLEERKRKAETAYAEQFGKSKKRYKQESAPLMRPDDTDEESNAVAVRRRNSVRRQTVSDDMSERRQSFSANTETLPPTLVFPTSTSTTTQRISHRRNSSRDSTSSNGSDRDRLKHVSRSELEKENQHLRELLRQRDRQDLHLDPHREILLSNTSRKSQDFSGRDSSPAREKMRAALSSHPVSEDDKIPDIKHALPNVDQRKSTREEKVPPVPLLPPSLATPSILKPLVNGPSWLSDTATIKRRGPVTTLGRAIELPRPLSMVLEGLEDDQHELQDDTNLARQEVPTPHKHASNGAKGSELPGLRDCKENWDWPEDVF